MKAYVVITVGPGKARDVATSVAKLKGVQMCNACWGSPDVFAVVEVAQADDLNKLVMDKIQKIEGVGRTETHIAID